MLLIESSSNDRKKSAQVRMSEKRIIEICEVRMSEILVRMTEFFRRTFCDPDFCHRECGSCMTHRSGFFLSLFHHLLDHSFSKVRINVPMSEMISQMIRHNMFECHKKEGSSCSNVRKSRHLFPNVRTWSLLATKLIHFIYIFIYTLN